jgi:antitoxin component YwqK of YwqJK toxin-antitoxin module
MRKFVFLFLSLLLMDPLHAASRAKPLPLISIQITDQNGLTQTIQTKERLKEFEKVNFAAPQPYQKVFRTYARDRSGKTRAIATTYWPNGQIQQCLHIVDSVAYGRLVEWHENGAIKLQAVVVGGRGELSPSALNTWLFNGLAQSWDENGNKQAEIHYEKGVLQGPSLYYYPCGTLQKRAFFSQGKLEGVVESYYPSGAIKETVHYKKGIREGESKSFFSSGEKQAEEYFMEGKLWAATYYSPQAEVIATVENGKGTRAVFEEDLLSVLEEVQEGVQQGKVQVFDKKGFLSNQFFLNKHIKHGPEELYYPRSNQKQLSIDWYEGKVQGCVRTWYPNGQIESEREYAHNKKNGLCTAWYEDGSLMLVEEFESDLLQRGKYFKKGLLEPVSQVEEGKGVVSLFDSCGTLTSKIEYENGKPLIK